MSPVGELAVEDRLMELGHSHPSGWEGQHPGCLTGSIRRFWQENGAGDQGWKTEKIAQDVRETLQGGFSLGLKVAVTRQ